MTKRKKMKLFKCLAVGSVLAMTTGAASMAAAQAVPGGTLDPTTIPKYITPLVIPPVMNNNGMADNYNIAVRQFQQQILPGGIWDTVADPTDIYPNFPATTIWSYGPESDALPDSSALGGGAGIAPAPNSQFNYPAYTFETISNAPVAVRWINDLVDADGNYLPHLLPVDQTLHWANPPAIGCRDGSTRTDCATNNPAFYTGPVPIVTHVHGAHVDGHSDGYPEAWWLPAANNIPAGYTTDGSLFDDAMGQAQGLNTGYADYWYRQDQPATTLWYHDHSLGMTRLNVYAGPAGFWLIRGGAYDSMIDGKKGKPAILPGPAPVAGQDVLSLNLPDNPVRNSIREIPIVIQDRSFNADGSLFYPDNRAFFEGLNVPGEPQQFPGEPELDISYVGSGTSDIAPAWNPEAFFNVMVVNGVSWPTLEVAPAKYRFRLLNGCNSRFLNLALIYDNPGSPKNKGKQKELPFFQIGAEQGFLKEVVRVETGFATALKGDGTMPIPVAASDPQQALLMALAERADVIVDFSKLPNGTKVRMINTAPDAPFGGFPDVPADPATSGQVMEFVVNSALFLPSDAKVTNPYRLMPVAEPGLGAATVTRQLSLNEGESEEVCVEVDLSGNVFQVSGSPHDDCPEGGEPFGPKEALLGLVDLSDPEEPVGIPLKWTDDSLSTPVPITLENGLEKLIPVSENPTVGAVEEWEIYNFTADAHPIHLHLVRFEVLSREWIPGMEGGSAMLQPWENGMKDTFISYPGEVTRIRAHFDVAGLYVWHCHIVEHEDNEMMRPYVVSP